MGNRDRQRAGSTSGSRSARRACECSCPMPVSFHSIPSMPAMPVQITRIKDNDQIGGNFSLSMAIAAMICIGISALIEFGP